MIKKITIIFFSIASLFVFTVPAFAHVVVKPNSVGVGVWQTFNVSVPNEKDNATVALKVLIPDGLNYVSPNVKPGWSIEIKKSGEGQNEKVVEIDWTGGLIPAGQRDDFFFSAQVPASETTVAWKAYQTYEDGTVISWDQGPEMKAMSDEQMESMEKENKGPYSQTKIINDFAASSDEMEIDSSKKTKLTFGLSVASLGLSIIALITAFRKKK